MSGSDPLEVIRRSAEIPATVHILYRKAVQGEDTRPREIEPYSIVSGRDGMLLRAYQLSPTLGWRYFMFHRIVSAKPGEKFKPRHRITFTTGEIRSANRPTRRFSNACRVYRDMVVATLADMDVDTGERLALEQFRQESGIRAEEMLFVHFTVFSEALAAALEDGQIEREEAAALQRLNTLLKQCGAGVIEG